MLDTNKSPLIWAKKTSEQLISWLISLIRLYVPSSKVVDCLLRRGRRRRECDGLPPGGPRSGDAEGLERRRGRVTPSVARGNSAASAGPAACGFNSSTDAVVDTVPPMGVKRPSGLAGWLPDKLNDTPCTGLRRGDDGDARDEEKDDAVTRTGTDDVLNVGLMGTAGIDGDVAVVVVVVDVGAIVVTVAPADANGAAEPNSSPKDGVVCMDDVRLLRASGDTFMPQQRRRDGSTPMESWRSLRRSRSA